LLLLPLIITAVRTTMKSLDELKTNRSSFSVSQAISDGWALVNKHLGYYILGGVLATLIGMSVSFIPYVGSIANSLIIGPCFMAGAVYITWQISKGMVWTDIGDIFKGFTYSKPVMVTSLIKALVSAALIFLFLFSYLPLMIQLFELSQDADLGTKNKEIEAIVMQFFTSRGLLLFALLMFSLLFVNAIWAFTDHFIVIYNLQGWQAMEMSRKVTSQHLLPVIGLFILLGIIIFISAIPCGIGLLFSLPLSIGAVYSAFAQITDCDKKEMDNEMFDFIAKEDQ
jgi:hypothetical protein